MTEAASGANGGAPLVEVSLISRVPLPSFAAGFAISLVVIGLVVSFHWLTGAAIWQADAPGRALLAPGFHSACVLALLVGYTPAAHMYLSLTSHHDLRRADNLAPLSGEGLRKALTFEPAVLRNSRIAGAVGVVVWVGGAIWLAEDSRAVLRGALAKDQAAASVLLPLVGWLLARAVYVSIRGMRAGVERSQSLRFASIDLLDLTPLHAEGRIGLRLALVWLVGSSISCLFFLTPGSPVAVWPLFFASIALAVPALLLPLRNTQLQIRAAKRKELERIATRLSTARDRALGEGEDVMPGRVADLLAYKSYVEGLREWPLDNSTVVRFALYLLIPIGSWLGGALVERLVERLLELLILSPRGVAWGNGSGA